MHYLNLLSGTLVLVTLTACAGGPSSGGSANSDALTIVSWGGSYGASQAEAYHKPWMAKTGKQVNSVNFNGRLVEIQNQIDSGQVAWDVVDLELLDVEKGCRTGLLERIDLDALPTAPDGSAASVDFIEGSLHECGVPTVVWSTVIAYDTSVLTTAPQTVADFFDTAKFPGKRGLRQDPKHTLEMALIADGVPTADVYNVLGTDAGVARALGKLDEIKGDILWWEASGQSTQRLVDGEVVMTTTYNGRVANFMIEQSQPLGILWDAQIWSLDYWAMPKGSSKPELALDFIQYSTSTKPLAAQASYIAYGPARKSSYAHVGSHHKTKVDMKPLVPTAPQNMRNALRNDAIFWDENKDDLVVRFNTWRSN